MRPISFSVIGLLFVALGLSSGSGQGGPSLSPELARLQGVWLTESFEHGGERTKPDQRFVFVGNRFFRIDENRIVEEGTFTIDAAGPIKRIDFRCLRGYHKPMTRRAIYELEGDVLRESGPWGTDHWNTRPAAFAEKTDLTNYRRVLRRERRATED